MKFKVGDKVEIVDLLNDAGQSVKGEISEYWKKFLYEKGAISQIGGPASGLCIEVTVPALDASEWFRIAELKLWLPKPEWEI